jgi:acetylglutamate kinase
MQGIMTAGISGKDGSTLQAEKWELNGQDIGFAGKIKQVDITLIKTLMENDFVPVISPIAVGEGGQSYNINADLAAVAIAGGLQAEKLVFLTDVEGILLDRKDAGSVLSHVKAKEIPEMITRGVISDGMVPKVKSCVEALEAGTKRVHILDGRVEHCLLLEIFTQEGIGTMIEL